MLKLLKINDRYSINIAYIRNVSIRQLSNGDYGLYLLLDSTISPYHILHQYKKEKDALNAYERLLKLLTKKTGSMILEFEV